MKTEINDFIVKNNDWTMFADGFDEAILGVDTCTSRVVYSVRKCYEILKKRDNFTQDEAEEFFAFNVLGVIIGEKSPIWCYDIF